MSAAISPGTYEQTCNSGYVQDPGAGPQTCQVTLDHQFQMVHKYECSELNAATNVMLKSPDALAKMAALPPRPQHDGRTQRIAGLAIAGAGVVVAGADRALGAGRPNPVIRSPGHGRGRGRYPSAGTAQVGGHDVVHEPLYARAQVGYLPEQVPLPRELRVREYLRYRAELKGVRSRKPRTLDVILDEVLTEVGLAAEQQRLLSQLSKGYRQRVGLADALLHRPKVLLLDEPTDGLDPNQRREVLQLITRLGQRHAVILSTHVLPEVESLCHRVVILSRGRVAAQGPLSALLGLLQAGGTLEVVARGDQASLHAALQAVAGVAAVAVLAAPCAADPTVHRFQVELFAATAPAPARELLARAVLATGELRELTAARSQLDAVFRFLTTSGTAPPRPAPPEAAP